MKVKDLILSKDQRKTLEEFIAAWKKCKENNIGFVVGYNNNVYAYNNHKEISCFDAPTNAAYEDKINISVDNLEEIYCKIETPDNPYNILIGLERN